MLSRRLFLMSTMGLAMAPELFADVYAKRRKAATAKIGPRSLSKQEWPPAICPNNLSIIDKSFVCLTDESGRLAIVDLKQSSSSRVLSESTILGRRVIDVTFDSRHAYALSINESDSGEIAYSLIGVVLIPPTNPTIVYKLQLNEFLEPVCLTARNDLIVVAGLALDGNNLVVVYRQFKSDPPSMLSSFTTDSNITALDLQDKHLVVLQGGYKTQVDYISLYYPHTPQLRKTIQLDGDYRVMARYKNELVVAGQSGSIHGFDIRAISLEPTPHAVDHAPLASLTNVSYADAQKGRFFVLGERGPERIVSTFTYTKTLELMPEQTIVLPASQAGPGLRSSLQAKERNIYVASPWSGVDVLSLDKTGWQYSFTYSIPTLPASSIANWDDLVVLAGADLKLYNIAKADKPVLVASSNLAYPLKAFAGAENYLLCLSKDKLALRKMDQLGHVLHATDVVAEHMAYDKERQIAYVIADTKDKTTIYSVKIASDKLSLAKVIDLPAGFNRVTASDGYLLARSMSNLVLYRMNEQPELIGNHSFDNLAIRDAHLTQNHVLAAAVDHSSKGFLILLAKNTQNLHTIGVVDLPHDATAVGTAGNLAVVVGKSSEGKDLLSVVNLTSEATLSVTYSSSVIEAASDVIVKNNLAIVAGRGLQIFALS
ncbi:MAG: hypothetical protein HY711_03610 [Candidatus Melainabacteria bacterium]|nr:hypothetical protein [Candidatus Melainabacteria bacterium]